MDHLIVIFVLALGLILGSFYNVIGLRIPIGKSIVWPRSQCFNCKRSLTTIELIPLVSFILLKGCCQSCKKKISAIYPLVELLTGLLFLVAYFHLGLTAELLVALLLISLLMIITVSDIRYMIIPDRILLFFCPVFLLLRYTIAPASNAFESLAGMLVGFIMLWLIKTISHGRMGGGDVKLFAVLGIVLGLNGVLLAFMLSCFFGALIGGVGMMLGKVSKGQPISFGPYIAIGTMVTYFFGSFLIQLYISLLK
ncbi:A24 family peptidase [Bacillus sp. JCM 19034]|uniref:prepilin peptidase n=1 Tax=Bacillus sp. JCM 19034 TaxID=1481928 RepID=UPI000784CEDC|nr:A24 family peptidase [Bacillus sp. JCM 19034]